MICEPLRNELSLFAGVDAMLGEPFVIHGPAT